MVNGLDTLYNLVLSLNKLFYSYNTILFCSPRVQSMVNACLGLKLEKSSQSNNW